MTELLVGSKKGLFVLRGEIGEPLDVATRAFPGEVVEFAMRDPRTGRTFASVTSGQFGGRLMFTDDPVGGDWVQAKGPAFPEDTDTALERIWIVQPILSCSHNARARSTLNPCGLLSAPA